MWRIYYSMMNDISLYYEVGCLPPRSPSPPPVRAFVWSPHYLCAHFLYTYTYDCFILYKITIEFRVIVEFNPSEGNVSDCLQEILHSSCFVGVPLVPVRGGCDEVHIVPMSVVWLKLCLMRRSNLVLW